MKKKNYLSKFEKETTLRNRNEEGVSVSSSLVQERINQVAKINFKNILALLICVFLFGTVNIFAQQIEIRSVQDFESIGVSPNFPLDGHYILMNDIGPVTQMVSGIFTGTFNGNNHKITVNINSDADNVGLFSVVAGGGVRYLTIDGQVTGDGLGVPQNVGALAGQIGIIGTYAICDWDMGGWIWGITNLAEVTCTTNAASVGGIAGVAYNVVCVVFLCNNALITGGHYAGGIFGRTYDCGIRFAKNAGTIKSESISTDSDIIYVAGIIGYAVNTQMHSATNIGKILVGNSNYAAGLVAYLTLSNVEASVNSGIVYGSSNSTIGGLFGYIDSISYAVDCINTNWVEPISIAGAIVGNNNGTIINCYFDEQMCILSSIGINAGITQNVLGFSIVDMIGNNLYSQFINPSFWIFSNNLYPYPYNANQPDFIDHPIDLLSAAPVYLQNNETVDFVRTNFFVSNANSFPFPNTIQAPPYFYQWESFSNGGIISVPLAPVNNAIIIGRGQDTLRVRLTDSPTFPDYFIYEKLIPVFVP